MPVADIAAREDAFGQTRARGSRQLFYQWDPRPQRQARLLVIEFRSLDFLMNVQKNSMSRRVNRQSDNLVRLIDERRID
jgi:hypothetical protein